MILLENFQQNLKEIREYISILLVLPFKEFWINIKKLYIKSKLKTFISISLILIPVIISIFTLNILFKSNKSMEEKNISIQKQITLPNIGGTDITAFVEGFKQAMQFFKPIFEGFIANTADPTGKIIKIKNSYNFDPIGSDRIIFGNGDSALGASTYSSIGIKIIIPIFLLLILLNAFNYIYDFKSSTQEILDFFKRIILTLSLLILTPFILSLSILAINLISFKFTEGKPLTNFITDFLSTINTQQNTGSEVQNKIKSIISFNVLGVGGFVQSLPLIIPLTLILILFLFVSFQFVIRFLNLFFLASIYPFAIIFYINPKTSNIPNSFCKQWVTFLLHQPAFIIGYVIVQNILEDMLQKNGPNFVQILLFMGLLIFLCSINVLTASIFGDIYTAVSTNIQAAFVTSSSKTFLLDKIHGGSYSANSISRNSSGRGNSHHNTVGLNNMINHPIKLLTTARRGLYYMRLGRRIGQNIANLPIFKDQSTKVTDSLNERKIIYKKLNGTHSGNLSISGSFIGFNDSKTKLNTLYLSEQDALKDGANKSNLKTYQLNNFEVKDLTNLKNNKKYNDSLNLYAIQSNQKLPKLTNQSSIKRIEENMQKAESFNNSLGIKGFIQERIDKSIAGSTKVIKIITP